MIVIVKEWYANRVATHNTSYAVTLPIFNFLSIK